MGDEIEKNRTMYLQQNEIKQHLETYYDETSNDSVLIYGNKTIYALFRYLHFLYSRMDFAYKLCKSSNPLYSKYETEQEMQQKYNNFLSHLSKLINGQIEEEIFEDECRKLLGMKSYELFTIQRVIKYVYNTVCDFDTDTKLHRFYKLFLSVKDKKMNKILRMKYFITASQIASEQNNKNNNKAQCELYQIQYFHSKILCISLCDKYQPQNTQNIITNKPQQTTTTNTNQSQSNPISISSKSNSPHS